MAKVKLKSWDSSIFLRTAKDIVGYIDVLLEDGEVDLFKAVLEDEIVRAIKRYGIDVNDIKRELDRVASQRDYVREHVDDILSACWRASREEGENRRVSRPSLSRGISRRDAVPGVRT